MVKQIGPYRPGLDTLGNGRKKSRSVWRELLAFGSNTISGEGSMEQRQLILRCLLMGLCSFSISGYALSPEAVAGKEYFQLCNSCHNPSLNPPLAPPMWGVQRRYMKIARDKEQFVDLVAEFASSPTAEKAIFSRAVRRLGLMPAVSMSEDNLRKVAAYIWEQQFPPPCEHWKNGARLAEKAGDVAHAKKDRKKLDRFCGQ